MNGLAFQELGRLESLPLVALGHLPTPLEEMGNLLGRGKSLLFVHTGGVPAVFGYEALLTPVL